MVPVDPFPSIGLVGATVILFSGLKYVNEQDTEDGIMHGSI